MFAMFLAEATDMSLPTTFGGVAVMALALIVWNFFADKKKNERDVMKSRNLQEQTDLLRTLVQQGKKDSKSARKTQKLLKKVNLTVGEIRRDQIQTHKP
jgi:hypothetical protein